MNLKSLAKDTAIYGISSIVGRFLNYLLVPLYTNRIAAVSGGYGIVSNLYGYTAFFLALLTFGMETTLFRFSGKESEDPDAVFSAAMKLVGGVALVFLALVFAFLGPLSASMGYDTHPEYIACMALVVAIDAFQAILFARLRQQKKALTFMWRKFAFIIPNILLNLVLFLVLPSLFEGHPFIEEQFLRFDHGVGFIFFVNLLCTASVTFLFAGDLRYLRIPLDRALVRRMLAYSWPLLLLSLVGVLNQSAYSIIFPYVMPGEEGRVQLGIYAACVKIAMIMSLLTQAFRYAYEPLVLARRSPGDKEDPQALADGMKYFIVFALLAFLAVMFYMPVLQYFVGSGYREGLGVVPVVMLAEIFMGIYFNLSFWYKLKDKTWWGALMSAAGAAAMICLTVFLIPRIGYWACAWGGFAGYGTSMLLSFFIGRHYMKVDYDFRTALFFCALAAILYGVSELFVRLFEGHGSAVSTVIILVVNTVLLLVYAFAVARKLFPDLAGTLRRRFIRH